MTVHLSKDGSIAVVKIDNPPVNATSHSVRQGLWEALNATESDPSIAAVVLICSGGTFIAGADVKEFDQAPREPTLPDLLMRMEQAKKPWIAALHGSALGGGLETALACSHRIATPDARLGLPEVSLGLIPGAGGTVRLPRLISPEEALAMVAFGKPISAQKAHDLGLVDTLATCELLADALQLARSVVAQSRPEPLSERTPLPFDKAAFDAIAARINDKAKHQNAPRAALAALRTSLSQPTVEAFRAERDAFVTLKSDPQSAALRHVFFAERATTRVERTKGIDPITIAHVGVIGGGTMGAGIAAACLLAGHVVTMIERDQPAAEAGAARVSDILKSSHKRGLLPTQELRATQQRLTTSLSYAALHPADLVIEAVFEDLAVKTEVFAQIAAHTGPATILATNTSYLDVNQIARTVPNPDRVIGLHFFSPAHIMKLLEVVVPDATSDRVLASGLSFARSLRKIPVTTGVCDGFIANRIMSAYRREAEYMLEDGALPWQIDEAMRSFGLPMGLFEMQDLAGLDISWAMRKRQAASRDPAARYVEIGDRLCEQGRFGCKTKAGYYRYNEKGKARPDPAVDALILAESARKGITRRSFTAEDIMNRILEVMQSEAQKILIEGIARNADDIDVVMINAYGFPRWKGGPMFMQRQAKAQVQGR